MTVHDRLVEERIRILVEAACRALRAGDERQALAILRRIEHVGRNRLAATN